MDELALQRANERIAQAREGRDLVRFEAVLERSRTQIEALATTASEIEVGLPDRIREAVGEGFRREVLPVGRQLAEIRGLLNNVTRRLERLEEDILAERHARIDDLAVLVDLISSGWRAVDARVAGLENGAAARTETARSDEPAQHRVVPFTANTAA
jgi:hypothetical protein